MKFSTIALFGVATAQAALTPAQKQAYAQRQDNAAKRQVKLAINESIDTIEDVARIHNRAGNRINRDLKKTLRREKRFWSQAPQVWQGYKDAWQFEKNNWQYTETATTGTWKLNNAPQVVAKWKAAHQASLEFGRKVDTTAARFIDNTVATKAAAKSRIRAEIQSGERIVRYHMTAAKRIHAQAEKLRGGAHTLAAQLSTEEALAREDASEVFTNIEEDGMSLVTDAEAAKWSRVVDKVHIAAQKDIDIGNQVQKDIGQYVQSTAGARQELNEEFTQLQPQARQVRQGLKEAWEYDIQNVHYDPVRPGHPGSIEFTNSTQVAQHWRSAIQADQNLGKEMVEDIQEYQGEIAPAQAALKNSIHTTWQAKVQAYQNAVNDVVREIQTPVASTMEIEPETLVTDAQAAKWRRVADKVHTAAKLDISYQNTVVGDLTKFMENTQVARNTLKQESQQWKPEARQVNQGFKDAWDFDMQNIHYDPVRPGHPGSIEFTNADQVAQKWRNAMQADQNFGKGVISDFNEYNAAVAPQVKALDNSTETTWKAKNIAYVNSVKDIIREIQTPATSTMEIDSETLVSDAEADKMTRVMDKIHNAAKLDIDLSNQVVGDMTTYVQATKEAREELHQEFQQLKPEARQVNQGFKEAWEYDIQNVHYDPVRPGHPGSIEFTNSTQVAQHWRGAIQADQNLGKEMVEDIQEYQHNIAPAKAALKNSINTNWKTRVQVYQNAVRDIVREIKTPVASTMELEPESLVTDAEFAKARRVQDKIHTAAKLDIDYQNTIVGDVTQYVEATQAARQQLQKESQGWKSEGAQVREGYRQAWEYDVENVHFEPVRPGHPGSIEFTNSAQVAQHWRDAIQADQNLGHEIIGDFQEYKAAVAPAKAVLKNSIKTTWKARNTAYVNSVKAIVQELKTPISASAVSMIAHPVETVGTENMIVAASCAAILAVVLGMKSKKASKSIEFEVDCEMVPQKESKKVIKKTLAKIMKNNSAKATLMN